MSNAVVLIGIEVFVCGTDWVNLIFFQESKELLVNFIQLFSFNFFTLTLFLLTHLNSLSEMIGYFNYFLSDFGDAINFNILDFPILFHNYLMLLLTML